MTTTVMMMTMMTILMVATIVLAISRQLGLIAHGGAHHKVNVRGT